MSDAEDLVWKALADPVRRAILDRLRDAPLTTGTLCAPFPQSRFAVMKHLGALEAAGLITIERRGRERWNHFNGANFERALARWLTPFQSQWSGRIAHLANFLAKEAAMSEISELMIEIRQEVDLPSSPERVFRALTLEIGAWWTSPFRQAGAESRLELRPEVGAPMIEFGAGGHEVIWARVEEIQPPQRLYLSGRFAMTGAVAGRIHFDLAPHGASGCRLTTTHQAIGRIAAEMRAAFAEGWRELIDRRLRTHLQGLTSA